MSIIVRDATGRISFGRWDLVVQGLIILNMVAFALETLPDLPARWQSVLRAFEVFSVGVFTIEYLLRLSLARPPRAYALSFFGVVDLLAILPSYLVSGLDLRTLRTFRLLRLFRILKLARYGTAVRRFRRAFVIIREELILFSVTGIILIYLAAVGIYYFESTAQPDKFSSVFHSLWWAIVTLTTVGYGDVFPVTLGGRLFTGLVLVVGVGAVAIPSGLFASALTKAREETESDDHLR